MSMGMSMGRVSVSRLTDPIDVRYVSLLVLADYLYRERRR
jgi:hypothetical protein